MKYTFRSPGRINLIGEHTDYNGGYVLPAAINKYTYITFEESDHFEVHSDYFDRSASFDLGWEKEEDDWINYVKGAVYFVAREMRRYINKWKIEISSDLPVGAGLSSSASLVVGIVYGLSKLENLGWHRIEIAKIAHEVENNFVGVKCGIMDQYAVTMGKKDSFIFLDAWSEAFEYIRVKRFPIITIIDSGVKHELSDGEYNKRRMECKAVENIIGRRFGSMSSRVIEEKRSELGEKLYKRARHVVEENDRVLKATNFMETRNWKELGELLYESHKSLRDLFEVSTNEIDFIVEKLGNIRSVYGARMIGGGFGGSVLALSRGYFDKDLKELSQEYKKAFGINMKIYHVKLSGGVRKCKNIS